MRTVMIPGLMIAVLALVLPATAQEADIPQEINGLPLVFSESFESGRDNWVETDPEAWKIVEEDGNHVFSNFKTSNYEPPVRSPLNMARIKDLDVSDFVIEVKMKQTGREYGHRDQCIFFGYNDPSHFYYVHLATKADDHANSIFLVNGEPRVSIAEERTDGTQWTDAYHTIRIERDTAAGTVLVYFDDMTKPVMRTTDTTFVSGSVGFGSFDDVGNIDDVRIWGKKIDANKP